MLWSKLRRQETGIQVVEARSKWKRANASSKDIWKLHRANLYCSGCSLVDCIRRKTLSRIVSKLQAGRLGLAQVSLHPHRHQEHDSSHHPLHLEQMPSCQTSRPTQVSRQATNAGGYISANSFEAVPSLGVLALVLGIVTQKYLCFCTSASVSTQSTPSQTPRLHPKSSSCSGPIISRASLTLVRLRYKIKHRKNYECCPGHYLSTSVY